MELPNVFTDRLTDTSFLKIIPKTDLHLHLDGSLRIQTLIELAKEHKVDLPSHEDTGLREQVFKDAYASLTEYLTGFQYTCSVMHTPEALERIAYELAVDNQKEGVRYIEVRFAPQLHISPNFTFEEVLKSVNRGLEKASKEFNVKKEIQEGSEPGFKYGIIVCAMRFATPGFSEYYRNFFGMHEFSKPLRIITLASEELAYAAAKLRIETDIPLVGFDLAGAEDGYPAEDHKHAFEIIHRSFIHKTVHAGEAYGPESIFQAITDLHAERLGHGFYLYDTDKISLRRQSYASEYVEHLVNYIANRRITIEVCLTSNLQTNPELKNKIENHTFQKMLRDKLSVSICTDNRLVSNTNVTKELKLAINAFKITPYQLKNIIMYGFKRSFYKGTYPEKRKYVRTALNYFEKIMQEQFSID